jgi:hypothetical protein
VKKNYRFGTKKYRYNQNEINEEQIKTKIKIRNAIKCVHYSQIKYVRYRKVINVMGKSK